MRARTELSSLSSDLDSAALLLLLTRKMPVTDSRSGRRSEQDRLKKLDSLLFLVICALVWSSAAAAAAPRDIKSNGKLRFGIGSRSFDVALNGDGTVGFFLAGGTLRKWGFRCLLMRKWNSLNLSETKEFHCLGHLN